jgi:hypothetical protein
LGVSLVAVAAIVASLTIARQRQEEAPVRERGRRQEHSPAAVDLDLEQLRAAGF